MTFLVRSLQAASFSRLQAPTEKAANNREYGDELVDLNEQDEQSATYSQTDKEADEARDGQFD
jgi:hypothetical protein